MRALRNPVVLFLLVGTVVVAAIFLGTNRLADRAARQEAIAEALGTTEVLGRSVVEPDVPKGLIKTTERKLAAADKMDRAVTPRLLQVQTAERVNLWTEDGRNVYSSAGALLLGRKFQLDEAQLSVLAEGGGDWEFADPERPEIREIGGLDGVTDDLVQTYTRIESPEGEPLLLEAYYTIDDIEQRRGEIYSSFRWITLTPLVLLIMMATLFLAALTRQLRRASSERERLLTSAMDASDAERRRIARDLHDSVVQDLAGTAFSVSAVSRTPDLPEESRETLDTAGLSLRTSLKSLRSLLAEIHPPDLTSDGLPAALADLTAPAAALDMQASVSVEGAETASDAHVALVWRVAQEAVRNAMRHSQASTLAVTVRGDGRTLTLEVVDDGIGFDPERVTPDSYGLRGLRSLVTDNGGVLEVRSSPGEGTTVRMEVDAQ